MSFIGVVAGKKCFENIRKKLAEELKQEDMNFVQINLRSIENVKNIKFETIIIEDNREKFKEQQEILKKICDSTQYVIINTDKNINENQINSSNYITYGLNQKANVTVSSISETDVLVYWQKSLKNKAGNIIEIEEKRVKKEKNKRLQTYEILIIDILFKLYCNNIIEIT